MFVASSADFLQEDRRALDIKRQRCEIPAPYNTELQGIFDAFADSNGKLPAHVTGEWMRAQLYSTVDSLAELVERLTIHASTSEEPLKMSKQPVQNM